MVPGAKFGNNILDTPNGVSIESDSILTPFDLTTRIGAFLFREDAVSDLMDW